MRPRHALPLDAQQETIGSTCSQKLVGDGNEVLDVLVRQQRGSRCNGANERKAAQASDLIEGTRLQMRQDLDTPSMARTVFGGLTLDVTFFLKGVQMDRDTAQGANRQAKLHFADRWRVALFLDVGNDEIENFLLPVC